MVRSRPVYVCVCACYRTRGISALAARQALVASFGAEVTQRLKLPALQKRMQADVNSKLQGIDFSSLEA